MGCDWHLVQWKEWSRCSDGKRRQCVRPREGGEAELKSRTQGEWCSIPFRLLARLTARIRPRKLMGNDPSNFEATATPETVLVRAVLGADLPRSQQNATG